MHERTNLPTDAAYTVRDQELMQLARHYFDWQAELVRAVVGRRPVEIGCGLGNFTAHLLDRDLVIATDIEQACTERLALRFPGAPNLVVHTLNVLSPEFASLRRYEPDSVVCLNVLEHVEDDALALRHMYQVLPDGGVVVLLVPAFESLYGPIDRLLGHYRRYSKSSMRQLAGRSGFKVKTLRFMNSVGFFGWWFNARVRKAAGQSEDQIRLFDRYVVPAMRRIEAVVPPPFGQSLFAVLTKPEGAER
ncbi:MAG: class I SAM-dependent methyltransferase [Bryobacteraceae bacterium]|nr:class I SAM-dependent methyltransferase [Bryobacteraceae bacterium]